MGGCSVFGCNNDMRKNITPDTSFHKFPKKNVSLTKKWTSFCKRKDRINVLTARICSLHFQREDFLNNTKFEMGFTAFHLLKPDALPTVYLKSSSKDSEESVENLSERSKRMESKKNKEVVKELLEAPVESESEPEPEPEPEEWFIENFPNATPQQDQIDDLTEKVKILREENEALKKQLLTGEKTIKSLENRVMKAEFEQSNLEEKLHQIFTRGQINKLKLGLKRATWSVEDMVRAVTLYSSSSRAYKLLQSSNFPLPAIRTLQAWAQKMDITLPGKIKTQMKNNR